MQHTSKFSKRADIVNLKSSIGKLDIDKLEKYQVI